MNRRQLRDLDHPHYELIMRALYFLDRCHPLLHQGGPPWALGRNIDRIERNIESIESKFAQQFSNRQKIARMARILKIFEPNESQRCQLKFEKILGRRKNFREGEKFEKIREKFAKIWPVHGFWDETK